MMDNYFISIPLFEELLAHGIYATGTIRSNQIGLPQQMKNTKKLNRAPQGILVWKMHESRSMACISWKDKRPVILLSIHATPIDVSGAPCSIVLRRNGAIREEVRTSPIHLKYTTFVKGVDIADQLRASYTCQTRSHKWWHRVFWFLLDTTVVNMYIYYLVVLKQQRVQKPAMMHLQFKIQFCEYLTKNWQRQRRQV